MTRALGYLLTPALAAVLAAGGSGQSAASGERPSVDLVELAGNDIGWCGVFLGSPRREVESMLDRKLEVSIDPTVVACGDHTSRVELCGREVTIQWSTPDPPGTVDSLWIAITSQEASTPARELSRRLRSRMPQLRDLRPLPEDPAVAYLTLGDGPDRQILMLKTGNEQVLDIAYERCFD